MGAIGCPETSVINYHYTLRNSPEERSSYLLNGESLKPFFEVHKATSTRDVKNCSLKILSVNILCENNWPKYVIHVSDKNCVF